MASRLWGPLGLAVVFALAGCNDLTVELEDDDKASLSTFVENDGEYPISGGDIELPDVTTVATLQHFAWNGLVGAYVRDDRVDYSGFNAAPDSQEVLADYLALIASVSPEGLESESERLAFWLNAYNATVFDGAARAVAADSAFRVDRDDFVFFDQPHAVGGGVWSLNEIEHGILRFDQGHSSLTDADADKLARIEAEHKLVFGADGVDSRIHLALNCASRSCPPLPDRAFVAADLEEALDGLAAAFVTDAERGAGPDGISSLFDWYGVDFERSHGSNRAFVEAYRDDVSGVDFDTFLSYDWALNGE